MIVINPGFPYFCLIKIRKALKRTTYQLCNFPAVGVVCSRTITAEYGHFVRVDFRDFFHIEPPSNEGNCDYDYLEVSRAQKNLC